MRPVFTTSARPAVNSCGGQGLERRQIAQHGRRLMERADQVLARLGVDRGLAADGGIDHGQQGGRHVDHPHPAQPGRRDEPGEVGDGTAAEPDHQVVAGESDLAEHRPGVGRDRQILGVFAVGHLEQNDLGMPGGRGQFLAQRLSRREQRPGMQHGDARGELTGWTVSTSVAEQADADLHRVRRHRRRAAPRCGSLLLAQPCQHLLGDLVGGALRRCRR